MQCDTQVDNFMFNAIHQGFDP